MQTIKEILRSAWTTNIEIEAKSSRLKALNKIDHTDISNKLSGDIKKLYRNVNIITNTINLIDNPAMRAVLIKRYIQFQKWHDIAFDLHYTERTVHRFHKIAIKILENKKMSQNVTTKN